MSETVEWENSEAPSYDVELSSVERLTGDELEQMSRFEKRMYHGAGQDLVEQMLIGYLIGNLSPTLKQKDPSMYEWINDTKPADKLLESGAKGSWFDSSARGKIFDTFLKYYQEHRKKLPLDDVRGYMISKFYKPDDAANFEEYIHDCYGAIISRRLSLDVLLKRFKNRYFVKRSDQIYQDFVKKRSTDGVDPVTAIDEFKKKVLVELSDPGGSPIKESDWIADYHADRSWMLDMKRHPEKYAGYKCGINAIDKKTNGFRNGHLTVFVGWHGGYKTTTMLNVAFGLWERKHNVLYVSLEMETRLMKAKLWSRGAGVSYSRIYAGLISEPSDWDDIPRLEAEYAAIKDKSPAEAVKIMTQIRRLQEGISGLEKSKCHTVLIDAFERKQRETPNRLKVINVGQSSKMKLSQLEKYIEEQSSLFKPQVVIVDYLDLVASEQSRGDARWEELGDICKYLRNMGETKGFSVITAAQFKRAAIERIREYGLKNPEKAQFSTDDIAGSNQIGADADNVFALWRGDCNKVQMFTPKSRHGIVDIEKGETLYVEPDLCKVTDEQFQETESYTTSSSGDMAVATQMIDRPGGLTGARTPDESDDDPDVVPTSAASVDMPQQKMDKSMDDLF